MNISAADAGRTEAELHARGYEIVETRWGQNVEFSIAVTVDGVAQPDGEMQMLTKGANKPSTDGSKIWWELRT